MSEPENSLAAFADSLLSIGARPLTTQPREARVELKLMIEAEDFVEAAFARGFDFYAGVPCSFLTPFINYVINSDKLRYISAANEGDAVALAAGAVIGGRRAVAMMQNSGLGNAVSPLTSLTWTFEIPLLVVCTHRGAPGLADEPQHELMGQITRELFGTMQLPVRDFPQETSAIGSCLDEIDDTFQRSRRPLALLMQKGTCAAHALQERPPATPPLTSEVAGSGFVLPRSERPSRHDVLHAAHALTADRSTVVIASTGYTGRELYALEDRPNHLYMVGSMGCASSLGLGLALARPDLKVVVLDGDGAALMRLGNFTTIGACQPANFIHLLLDNEAHDSTGAQATVSASVDFAALAAACGYRRIVRTDNVAELSQVFSSEEGPTFAHFKTRTGTIENLPRPSITPPAVATRFMHYIGTK